MSNVVIISSFCCFFSFVGLPPHIQQPFTSVAPPANFAHPPPQPVQAPYSSAPPNQQYPPPPQALSQPPYPSQQQQQGQHFMPTPSHPSHYQTPHPLPSPKHQPVSMYPHRAHHQEDTTQLNTRGQGLRTARGAWGRTTATRPLHINNPLPHPPQMAIS